VVTLELVGRGFSLAGLPQGIGVVSVLPVTPTARSAESLPHLLRCPAIWALRFAVRAAPGKFCMGSLGEHLYDVAGLDVSSVAVASLSMIYVMPKNENMMSSLRVGGS